MDTEGVILLLLNIVATVFTCGLQLAVLPRMLAMERTGKADGWYPFSFAMLWLCNLCFVVYGVHFREDGATGLRFSNYAVIVTNLVGSLSSHICSLLWVANADRADKFRRPFILTKFLATALFMVAYAVLWIVFDASQADRVAFYMGIGGNIFAILYLGAPLLALRTVIREKNSAYFSKLFGMLGLVAGAAWVSVGAMTSQLLLILPNATGFVMTSIQLIFCFIYKANPDAINAKTVLEGDAAAGVVVLESSPVSNPEQPATSDSEDSCQSSSA